MERQKKPWEEMTEEERQVVRESWKDKLPEKYDVFCIGDFVCEDSDDHIDIPGTLYVSGILDVFNLTVRDALIVEEYIDAADITVYVGPCYCDGDIIACDFSVNNGDFVCEGDIDVSSLIVLNGNCFVHDNIDSYAVKVNGTLECFDIETHKRQFYAKDFTCRCFEENI